MSDPIVRSVQSDRLPPAVGPYSPGMLFDRLIFVSGQGANDPATGKMAGLDIETQTEQVLRNIEAILHAAGSSLEKAVSATWILGEETDFAGMNEEWGKWFPKDPPARQGAKLAIHPKGMKISIALVAEA